MVHSLESIPWMRDLLPVLWGLAWGSFLNVCIHRLPKGQSLVRPGSHCPSCGRPIAWFDNVPVLSYLVLRGRCRHCRAWIHPRYPLVEAGTGFLSWLLFHRYGLDSEYFVSFFYSAALVTVSLIDLEHRIIPDVVSLPGIAIGLVLAAWMPTRSLGGAVAGLLLGGGFLLVVGILYEAARKQEGIGGGDVKLLAMIGVFTGWKGVLFTVFFASLLASILGIVLMIVRRSNGRLPIPFGPFLSGASLIYLFAGESILEAYWHLLAR